MSDILADGAAAPVESTSTPIVEGEQSTQETLTQETAAPAEPKPEKPAKDPVQKRFDRLTWERHEADRRANAAAIELQRVQQQLSEYQRQQFEAQRRATMPTLEQSGMDINQYQRAVEAHNQQFYEAQRQHEQQLAQVAQQQAQARQVHQFVQARISEAKQKYEDYDEVVGNPSLPVLPQVNPALFQAVMQHEQMPELTYFLGKNPGEAHRIASLPPALAIMELGRVAAKMQTPAKTSTAPAPPAQVGGIGGEVKKAPEQMTDKEFSAWYRKIRNK